MKQMITVTADLSSPNPYRMKVLRSRANLSLMKNGWLFILLIPAGLLAQARSVLLEDSVIIRHNISRVVRTTYDNNRDSMLLEVMTESFDAGGRLVSVERLTNGWRQTDTFVYAKKILKTSSLYETRRDGEDLRKVEKTKIRYEDRKRIRFSSAQVPDVTLDSLGRPVRYRNATDGYFVFWHYDIQGRLTAKRMGYDFENKRFGELTDSMYYDEKNRLSQKMTFSPAQFQNIEMKPELRESVWYFYNRQGLKSGMITSRWNRPEEAVVYRYHYHYSFFDKAKD